MTPKEIYELFGQRVAEARGGSGFTQAELASLVGISRASIANIEAGRQRVLIHQALELARALGLASIDDLLPTDLVISNDIGPQHQTFKLSGSEVSKSEADAIARIIASS